VTIAPKGVMAREATPKEAAQLNPGASFADVAGRAGQNLLPSAKRFGEDLWNVVSDPAGTGKTLLKTVAGTGQKLIPGAQQYEPYADAVGQFFSERYGGLENVKRTMAEDPVGFLADLSTVLTGGQLAAARAPGVVGQIGRAAGTASRAIDPIQASLKGAGLVGKGVGKFAAGALGMTTGAGGKAIGQAARAGLEGGEAAKSFRENMRGSVPMEEVITDAKSALGEIKRARSAAYNAGMANVRADAKVLKFGKIETALNTANADFTFKGVSISPSSSTTLKELATVIDEWKRYDPKEFHTAAGFDALKKRIGTFETARITAPLQRPLPTVFTRWLAIRSGRRPRPMPRP
jgi:hypothetical protein